MLLCWCEYTLISPSLASTSALRKALRRANCSSTCPDVFFRACSSETIPSPLTRTEAPLPCRGNPATCPRSGGDLSPKQSGGEEPSKSTGPLTMTYSLFDFSTTCPRLSRLSRAFCGAFIAGVLSGNNYSTIHHDPLTMSRIYSSYSIVEHSSLNHMYKKEFPSAFSFLEKTSNEYPSPIPPS